MTFKLVFFCAQLCLIKTAFTQCLGPKPALIPDGLGMMGIPDSRRFESSLLLENYPMPTPGLSIMADDLIIEGLVSVSGSLPFLGTVALEGILPTEGHGTVLYGCGNGEVAIMGENAGPLGPMAGPMTGPIAGPVGPAFGGPMAPGFGPFGSFGNFGPVIEPGMPAAAANAMGPIATMNSVGLGAPVNAAGLSARARL